MTKMKESHKNYFKPMREKLKPKELFDDVGNQIEKMIERMKDEQLAKESHQNNEELNFSLMHTGKSDEKYFQPVREQLKPNKSTGNDIESFFQIMKAEEPEKVDYEENDEKLLVLSMMKDQIRMYLRRDDISEIEISSRDKSWFIDCPSCSKRVKVWWTKDKITNFYKVHVGSFTGHYKYCLRKQLCQ